VTGSAAGRVLRQTLGGLLDLVYPPQCLICGAGGEPVVCDVCSDSFAPIPEPVCARCGRPVGGGSVPCLLCAAVAEAGREWGFDTARAAAIYAGPLRHGIHRLKFHGAEPLGEPLGAFLANRLVADGLIAAEIGDGIDAVAFVPMDPWRERRRGYNQARLLAEPVAALLGVPLLPGALRRARRAPAQVGLTRNERLRNLTSEAFSVRDAAVVAGHHLLLIDDVFTTGTTASACAAALKAAGARRVTVATLAAGG
jgi:Predicted amidophosphoribosyltransferases